MFVYTLTSSLQKVSSPSYIYHRLDTIIVYIFFKYTILIVQLADVILLTVKTFVTFNNPLKVCCSNKKYTITTQTGRTQIVKVYLSLKSGFNGILKIFL